MMSRYLLRWNHKCCGCGLKTFGFIYGWMGVIWRVVGTMFLSVTLSRTTYYDPNIFDIALITALSYVQLSLLTNLLFLIGIQKDKPYFLLPYTVIGGLELFLGIVIFIFATIFLNEIAAYLLWGFIPIILATIGIYMYFWIKSIQLYRQMEVDINRKLEENARIAVIRKSLAL